MVPTQKISRTLQDEIPNSPNSRAFQGRTKFKFQDIPGPWTP